MHNAKFVSLLKFAAHAQALKDIRYYLNGVMLDFTTPGKLSFVGTDGHRMAVVTTDATGLYLSDRYILPTDAVKKITTLFAKQLDDVTIEAVDASNISINGTRFDLIDGVYPDYSRVMVNTPSAGMREAVGVKPEYVADAMKALSAVNKKAAKIEMQSATEAMRLSTVDDEGLEYVAIVMPIRL